MIMYAVFVTVDDVTVMAVKAGFVFCRFVLGDQCFKSNNLPTMEGGRNWNINNYCLLKNYNKYNTSEQISKQVFNVGCHDANSHFNR